MRRERTQTIPAALLIGIALLASGCDRRAWYEGMQSGQRQQCQRLPPAEARDCESRLPGNYERYERERPQ
jgi:hypothetical protein